MDAPSGQAAGFSDSMRKQATVALRTLAQVLQNSISEYDRAVKRSAELSATASAINLLERTPRNVFIVETGKPLRLELIQGRDKLEGAPAEVRSTDFATGIALRNAQLIKNAPRALLDSSTGIAN